MEADDPNASPVTSQLIALGHPAGWPADALLTPRQLSAWVGRSESYLAVCRTRGRGFPYVRLPDGGIRYRVGTIRAVLAALEEVDGTHRYPTHAVAGPGRPRKQQRSGGEEE